MGRVWHKGRAGYTAALRKSTLHKCGRDIPVLGRLEEANFNKFSKEVTKDSTGHTRDGIAASKYDRHLDDRMRALLGLEGPLREAGRERHSTIIFEAERIEVYI